MIFCLIKKILISVSSILHKILIAGRNEKGQLGLGHLNRMDKPTLVDCLAGCNVIAASCGRNHTLFLTGLYCV